MMARMMIDLLLPMLAQAPWGPGPSSSSPPPTDADVAAAIASVFVTCGIVLVVSLVLTVGIGLLIGWFVKNAMEALPAEFQRYEPKKAYLLAIPFFPLYYNFVAHPGLCDSYADYFRSIGRADVGDAGRQLAWWYAMCVVLSLVPCVGSLAGPASLVLLIMYLVKVYDLKKQIGQPVIAL